ncbi:hypothetical protein, partial [Crocosphaera watsonii]|uniref:hypothetical protein n=1 Tax=Crocosphaera watsonii TaxID=263511 RepID=UPI001E63A40A
QLRLLEEVDSFNEDAKITFSIKVSASNPLLLRGLDRWVKLGLLTDKHIKDIARQDLSCPAIIIPRKTETFTPVNTPSKQSLPIPKSQVPNTPKKRQKIPSSPSKYRVAMVRKKKSKNTQSSTNCSIFNGGTKCYLVAVIRGVYGSSFFGGNSSYLVGKVSGNFAIWNPLVIYVRVWFC